MEGNACIIDGIGTYVTEKRGNGATDLLLILLLFVILLGGGGGTLALNASSTSSTIGGGEGEVNVLLGVEADNERRNVDNLLADTDVPLPDEDTSVVDRLGKAALEDLGLQPTLQEILDLQGQHVIETHAALVEHTNAHETADKGVTLEETLGVLVIELEELTGSTTNLGKDEGNAPNLALVTETVFSSKLKLGIETRRLERATGDLVAIELQVTWGALAYQHNC